MTFVSTEKSITFIIDGEMYFCSVDDMRYESLKQALNSGNEKDVLDAYYSRFINDAKSLLNGMNRGVDS